MSILISVIIDNCKIELEKDKNLELHYVSNLFFLFFFRSISQEILGLFVCDTCFRLNNIAVTVAIEQHGKKSLTVSSHCKWDEIIIINLF